MIADLKQTVEAQSRTTAELKQVADEQSRTLADLRKSSDDEAKNLHDIAERLGVMCDMSAWGDMRTTRAWMNMASPNENWSTYCFAAGWDNNAVASMTKPFYK